MTAQAVISASVPEQYESRKEEKRREPLDRLLERIRSRSESLAGFSLKVGFYSYDSEDPKSDQWWGFYVGRKGILSNLWRFVTTGRKHVFWIAPDCLSAEVIRCSVQAARGELFEVIREEVLTFAQETGGREVVWREDLYY